MQKFFNKSSWFSISFLFFLFTTGNLEASFKIVAYFPLYSTVEEANKVDYSKFTHVNLEAIYSTADGKLSIPNWSGVNKENVIIDTIISKGHAAGINVILTVGYSESTLQMIEDSVAREKFSDTLIQYCKAKGIEGIDLDLEGSFDANGYAKFAQTIRKKIKNENLILSAAVTGVPAYSGSKWTDDFLEAVDFINVMIYDIKGSWDGSPIGNHASYEDYVKAATEWNKRIDKDKIVLGTPLYGRTFADDGTMRIWGNKSWSSNALLYRYIVKYFPEELLEDTAAGEFNKKISDLNLSSSELSSFNADVFENYSNNPSLTGDEMLGKTFFSGPQLTKKKTKYALQENYGGMMILKLSYDTYDSNSLVKVVCDEIDLYQSDIKVINSKKKSFQIRLFPNKVIQCPINNVFRAQLYALNGKLIADVVNDKTKKIIFNNHLIRSKGVLVLKLISTEGVIYTEKLVLSEQVK